MNNIVIKRLLISLGSIIFALSFQFLCKPRDFLDLDDFDFWIFLILGFIVYWTFFRIIIWIIDGYKLNTNTGITKLLVSLPSIAVALGVQYLLKPRDFLDFDDLDFWFPVTLAFAGYWTIVRIIIWVIDGYKLNIKTGEAKLVIALLSMAIALGVQYLIKPYDFLDFDDAGFWSPVILAFAGYWAIVRIIIWVIDGYKLNINTGIIKLLIAIFAFIFALGIQYLCEPRNFFDFDDADFWGFLTFGFIIYWGFVRIVIWIIDGYKLNINTGNVKLIISLASIAVALGVQYLIDPYDFLDFDDADFWLPVTLTFAGYWAIVRIIIWIIDGYKLNTNTGITKLLVSLTSIAFALGIQYLINPHDFLDLNDDDFWLPVTLAFAGYWATVTTIIWGNGYKKPLKH